MLNKKIIRKHYSYSTFINYLKNKYKSRQLRENKEFIYYIVFEKVYQN